jgi:hypothetical protein
MNVLERAHLVYILTLDATELSDLPSFLHLIGT